MGEGGGSCLRDYAYHKMIAYRMVLVRFFLGGGIGTNLGAAAPAHVSEKMLLVRFYWGRQSTNLGEAVP